MKQYNAKYDAYYDDEQNVWLEPACGNTQCEYCSARPATPLAVVSKYFLIEHLIKFEN